MSSKFALVIANTEYQDASFAKLTAPGKDAEEFAHVFRDSGLAGFDDVQVLINEGESKTRRFIARFFAERKPADLLLLYFSGHGVRNGQGQLFLAANDTEISILEATGIPAEFVTYAMNNSRSQRQLLILDCCNSGAFAHGSKSASGVGKSMGIATAFEGSGFGRVVLTATDATQYAWEGDKVIGNTQKSVFTHFLIEGLKGDADRDEDGRIHVDELYDYAYEQVVRRTPKQTPGKWSYKQQGDIVLRENLRPRDVKPAPLPPDLLELLSHPNSGVRKVGVQDLISLLEGKHLGLTRAAEEKLREIAENDDSFTLRKNASETLIAHGITLGQPIEIPKEDIAAVKPTSVEAPKKESTEKKKIEKPMRTISLPKRENNVSEKTLLAPSDWRSIVSNSKLRLIGAIVAGLLILSLLVWGGSKLLLNLPTTISEPTPSIGSSMDSERDGMTLLYVPAGEFTMGSNNGEADEQPVHKVTLDAFWIDQTEVTNAKYALCVEEGACNLPSSTTSSTRDRYYGNAEFDNYPVIYVSWNDAFAYCSWADRRLPTEAEWEKAARGKNEFGYPWGNDAPNNNLLNYNSNVGDTTEVGKYPSGASPYSALDMAGNVWEWVADWYSNTYYASSPTSNPLGPDSGQYRVLRGGTWNDSGSGVSSAFRTWVDPTDADVIIGFRCAVSANRQADITPLAQITTETPSSSQTSQPTRTDTPLPTETLNPATPTPGIGSTMTSEKDGMTLLYVPAGEFTMGSSDIGESDEKPVHQVTLDAFWIDQTEVTNAMYAKCVQEDKCSQPSNAPHYEDFNYANHPVVYVSWIDANAYCAWVDRRLPTEAEWEKAARGDDARTYPWGNSAPNNSLLNYGPAAIGSTTEVGEYLKGVSPYGALDMAGNVSEWVADWYSKTYYNESPTSNPLGPDKGKGGYWDSRVIRGGTWISDGNAVRSAQRSSRSLDVRAYNNTGFRCAMSAAP